MQKPAIGEESFELCIDEARLATIVCDQSWPSTRVLLSGPLQDKLDVSGGHAPKDLVVQDGTTHAVKNGDEIGLVAKLPQVADVDMPMIVQRLWLDESSSFLRWFNQ